MKDFSNEEKYMLLQAIREKMLRNKERASALRYCKWPNEMRPYVKGLNKDLVVLKRLEQELQLEVDNLIKDEASNTYEVSK